MCICRTPTSQRDPFCQLSTTLYLSTATIHEGKGLTHTLNTIRLSQLRTVFQQRCIHILPILAFRQPHIDMCRRQFIHMEPYIFVEAVFDELLIYNM